MNAPSPIGFMAPVLNPATETTALINMIERAARDPAVDLDKLERLIAQLDRIRDRAAETAFDEAMSAAQSEMRAVVKDSSNPQTRSRYASYFALDRELRPIYVKHGFSLSFDTAPGPTDNSITILCRVANAGHARPYKIPMPADGMGAKGAAVMTRTHATGSAITYGRRYLLVMIFNVVVNDMNDDDGNLAGEDNVPAFISADQQAMLKNMIEEKGRSVERFCAIYGATTLAGIPTRRYSEALAQIANAPAKAVPDGS